jgi:hypothetical protein
MASLAGFIMEPKRYTVNAPGDFSNLLARLYFDSRRRITERNAAYVTPATSDADSPQLSTLLQFPLFDIKALAQTFQHLKWRERINQIQGCHSSALKLQARSIPLAP